MAGWCPRGQPRQSACRDCSMRQVVLASKFFLAPCMPITILGAGLCLAIASRTACSAYLSLQGIAHITDGLRSLVVNEDDMCKVRAGSRCYRAVHLASCRTVHMKVRPQAQQNAFHSTFCDCSVARVLASLADIVAYQGIRNCAGFYHPACALHSHL